MSLFFKIHNIFSKSPKILALNRNYNIVGNCTFSIIDKTNACINNLYIDPKYRNCENGSKLLQYTEKILKTNFSIEKTTLLAHENVNSNLNIFFKKNGYFISDTDYDIYDDGSNIYNLIPMHKHLNIKK